MQRDGSARQPTGLTTAVAARLTHHSSVYAVGFGTTLAFSFVNVAVLTRFIDPASFGKLAVLLIFAALLTVLYNLGSLQGAFHAAYGSADDDDGAADDQRDGALVRDRAAALTTALVLTGLIAGAGTLVVASMAPSLSNLLLGNRADGDLVLLAAASGAMGSLWRLLSNVPRLERRPTAYVVLSNLRPVLVLAISLPLVIEGAHVAGVLIGTAVGTAVSVLLGLIACRRNFALAFDRSLVLPMLRWGLPFVPLIVSFWVIHNVDLFILSDVASSSEVGLYRVASRIAAVASYFLSAFLMAWTPLRRTSLFIAAEEETEGGIRSTIVTYFALGSMGLLVVLTTGADALIHVAGPAYADAAGLIPVLGLAFVAYGAFVVTYRAVRFPNRRRTYVLLAAAAAVVFLVAALLLTPPLGGYGAALAPVIAFTLATAALVLCSSRGPVPLRFDPRIAGAVALAAVCILVSVLLGDLVGPARPLLDFAALVSYPLGIVALGILPVDHLAPLGRMTWSALQGFSGGGGRPVLDLGGLEAEQRRLLLLAAQGDLATGESPGEQERTLVRGLRRLCELEEGSLDAEIGAYLLSQGSAADRDAAARQLRDAGVSALELDRIERALLDVRGAAMGGAAQAGERSGGTAPSASERLAVPDETVAS